MTGMLRHAAPLGTVLAVLALVTAIGLWVESGAWQMGGMPTRGMLRASGFALGALACLGLAAWLRRRAD